MDRKDRSLVNYCLVKSYILICILIRLDVLVVESEHAEPLVRRCSGFKSGKRVRGLRERREEVMNGGDRQAKYSME